MKKYSVLVYIHNVKYAIVKRFGFLTIFRAMLLRNVVSFEKLF